MVDYIINNISKLGKYSFYVSIIYILGMTGLYFHMDSRIKVLNGIQKHSLELFKDYIENNGKQQEEINDLKERIGDLQDQVENVGDSLDEKITENFTELYKLLLKYRSASIEKGGEVPEKH